MKLRISIGMIAALLLLYLVGYVWFRRLIEAKGGRRDPLIGFVGIYRLEIGRRLYLSVVLFDPEDRRRGHGRQALTLLFHSLNRVGLAKEVRAEVLRSNADSLAFFRAMDFSLLADQGDRLLLTRTLAGCHNHIEAKPDMSVGELSRERREGHARSGLGFLSRVWGPGARRGFR